MPSAATDIQLHNQDCLDGLKSLRAGSVDLVVTSPPYNLGIAYSKYKDTLERDAYLDWSVEWATAVKRVLKPDGSLFLNVGAAPSNPFMPYEILLRLREVFQLQNTFHWIKSISIETAKGDRVSAGHFKPINSPRFVNDCHEFIFHLTKSGNVPVDRIAVGVPYEHKSNIARWGHTEGKDLRCRGNTWFIPYKTIRSRDKQRPHPATFPVKLAKQCIDLHGKGKKTVMCDPFVGIGHAALAAKESGIRKFIGFDIDAHYIETARQLLGEEDSFELES